MRRILPFATALVLGFAVAPARAQSAVDEIAADISIDGLYVEPGLSADTASLDASITRAGNEGVRLMVVLLDADPGGGAVSFANALLDRVPAGSTVLVLSASSEGIASDVFPESTLDGAIGRGFAAASSAPSGMGDEAYVAAVVDALTGTTAGSGEVPATTSGGSSSGLIVMLVVVGGMVLLVWWAIRRSKTSAMRAGERSITEAKKEVRAQLDAMANVILEITDVVGATADEQDDTYLREASATYTQADEAYSAANDLRSLEALSDRLDEARWQLDAAAAIAHGQPVPPKPPREQRYVCFFDPTHPNATETAQITTAAGTQTVRVCAADAEKLRRGTQPQPRMIDVAGRRVPAPMAPRSYGGGGFDLLDVFTILIGGMGQGSSYDWGGNRMPAPRRRSTWSVGRSSGGGRSSWGGGRSSGSVSRSSGGGSRSSSGASRGRRR